VPVVVNRNIVGGWKYVNEDTGSFFTDENDVVEVYADLMERIREGRVRPREWYREYAEI
jgi:hypothetical protein